MGNWTANYVIYENHVNPHIGIHKNGCSQIEKNGGNGIGKYIGFSNFDDAYEYAKSSNLPIKDCSLCIKNIQNKYSCEKNMDIVEEKEFKLNGTVYIARNYKGTKRDIIYKETREVVKNIKGIARAYLKQFNENVSTDANVMNTYDAVNLLMKYC